MGGGNKKRETKRGLKAGDKRILWSNEAWNNYLKCFSNLIKTPRLWMGKEMSVSPLASSPCSLNVSRNLCARIALLQSSTSDNNFGKFLFDVGVRSQWINVKNYFNIYSKRIEWFNLLFFNEDPRWLFSTKHILSEFLFLII